MNNPLKELSQLHEELDTDPQPQEQKVAPPVDGQSKSAFTGSDSDTPAGCGPLEPVAWRTHHDEPMLFPTKEEAEMYCDDDEPPVALVDGNKAADTITTLVRERDEYAESVLKLIKTVRYMQGIAEHGNGSQCPEDMPPEKFVLNYVKELEGKIAALQALSVTNILMDVVPGDDGMGLEIYAKSVKQVEQKLTELAEKNDSLQAEIEALKT